MGVIGGGMATMVHWFRNEDAEIRLLAVHQGSLGFDHECTGMGPLGPWLSSQRFDRVDIFSELFGQ